MAFLYPAILNGGVLCYHYVRRAGLVGWCPQVWPPLSWTPLTNPYGPYVVWKKFCVSCIFGPLPQCFPRGSQRSTFQIWHDNWSQSWPILMKLHGCIPWSGSMVPIVLLLDTMNYVPLAAILLFHDFMKVNKYRIMNVRFLSWHREWQHTNDKWVLPALWTVLQIIRLLTSMYA